MFLYDCIIKFIKYEKLLKLHSFKLNFTIYYHQYKINVSKSMFKMSFKKSKVSVM